MRKRESPFLGPAAALFVLVAAHLLLFPRVADLDSFYHLGHAAHYLATSPFDTAFPWATQSAVADAGADLWWGFHVVLMPFGALADPADGIHLAGVVLSLVLATTVFAVLRRHRMVGAGWWTALFLVAVPNILYRFLMVRPHVLSTAALLLLASFLVRGRAWQVLVTAATVTWLHLSLFWMAPGILVATALARRLAGGAEAERAPRLPAATAAVVGGTMLGWVLRPHPLGAAELARIQILQLFAELSSDHPIAFAGELAPLTSGELVRSSWLFLLAWSVTVGAGVHLLRARPPVGAGAAHPARDPGGPPPTAPAQPGQPGLAAPERTLALIGTLVSAAFLGLTLVSARRAQVEWVVWGFLPVALLVPGLVSRLPRAPRRMAMGAAGLLLAVHLVWGYGRHRMNTRLAAFPPDLLAAAAAFLQARAEPGDTVFHAHWDNFGPLFARNRAQRYIGGMDPIFQFARDPGRYWEYFFLSADLTTEWTCDAFPCYEGTATDTWVAIRRHFGARWVVIEPQRNPELLAWLRGDPRFREAVDTGREVVFQVLDAAEQGG